MPRPRFYVGPPWPPKLAQYDYLCHASNSDWAWEFLRRNPRYQCEYKIYQLFTERPIRHTGGNWLTRTRRRCRAAEAWEVCSFRGSIAHGKIGADRLAADQRWTHAYCLRGKASNRRSGLRHFACAEQPDTPRKRSRSTIHCNEIQQASRPASCGRGCASSRCAREVNFSHARS